MGKAYLYELVMKFLIELHSNLKNLDIIKFLQKIMMSWSFQKLKKMEKN